MTLGCLQCDSSVFSVTLWLCGVSSVIGLGLSYPNLTRTQVDTLRVQNYTAHYVTIQAWPDQPCHTSHTASVSQGGGGGHAGPPPNITMTGANKIKND